MIHLTTERQGIPVEVALTYNTTFNENVHSFVNNINTIEGGTHLSGFRRGLTTTLKKYAEDNKLFDKVKVEVSGDDFREGLTAVISVKVLEPQFEGQTKTKLGNSEVAGAVSSAVSEALRYYLEEHPKQAKTIVEKVALAAQARHAAYNARNKILRKSPLAGGGLPVSSPIAPPVMPRIVSSSSSRVILQVEPQSRVATELSRPFFLCVEKS